MALGEGRCWGWGWGRGGAEAGCGDWRRGEERYCGQDILYEKIIKKNINVYELHKGWFCARKLTRSIKKNSNFNLWYFTELVHKIVYFHRVSCDMLIYDISLIYESGYKYLPQYLFFLFNFFEVLNFQVVWRTWAHSAVCCYTAQCWSIFVLSYWTSGECVFLKSSLGP